MRELDPKTKNAACAACPMAKLMAATIKILEKKVIQKIGYLNPGQLN